MGRYYITNSWNISGQRHPGSFVVPGQVVPQTAGEALKVLWDAATRDPYVGDIGALWDSRLVLERALGLERSE